MHTRVLGWITALVLGVFAHPLGAVTVLECVDASGATSFRDKCPPGMTKAGEKKLYGQTKDTDRTIEDIARDAPVTLYSVPNCDACDLVRSRLNAHQLPFTEKDVQDNADVQEEMKASTGGLTVPAVLVGKKVLTGYSSDALEGALLEAGYPAIQ